jgi:tRNA dimethylallyltransferase
MKIGTAVPAEDELNKIRHHFIHHLSIHDNYNASRFELDAMDRIENLFTARDQVTATGGSMLYIDALCKGIDIVPDIDPEIRCLLIDRLYSEGIESLRFELKQLDPDYYREIDLKNPKRILHALEVCHTTGKPFSSFRNRIIKKRPFEILKIGLTCERDLLYERINQRVDAMIAGGLVEEARKLMPWRHLNTLNTVGYKELFDYFDGNTNFTETIKLIKRNTRRYARKQLTWFGNDAEINWFYYNKIQDIIEFIKKRIYE